MIRHRGTLTLLTAVSGADEDFPTGEGDLRVTQLLSGLACTVHPTRNVLYKQLGNLRILRRESALCASKADEPILDILRKAPVLSSSTEEQYFAATVAQVAALEHCLCIAYS